MRKIITTILIALFSLSAAMSQPLAENGFFYNDFSVPSYSGMTFTPNSAVSLSGANVSGTGPLILSITTTPGYPESNTGSPGPSGLNNYIKIDFSIPTGGFFNYQSAKLTLDLTSSQNVGCVVVLTNTTPSSTPENIYSSQGRVFGNNLNISAGRQTYNVNFSDPGTNEPNFSLYSNLSLYIVYNYTFIPGGGPKPAGTITFNGITFGTSMTGYSLTANDITNTHGSSTITPSMLPINIPGISSFSGSGLAPIAYLYTVDGISSQVTASDLGNGPVTITGTSRIYPYLSATTVINISNNPPISIPPTFVGITPSTTTLGRSASQSLTVNVLPSNANYTLQWVSLDISRATVNAAGLVTIPSNAPPGIVTITAFAKNSSVTVSGISIITVQTTTSCVSLTGIDPTTITGDLNPCVNSGIVYSLPGINNVFYNVTYSRSDNSSSAFTTTGIFFLQHTLPGNMNIKVQRRNDCYYGNTVTFSGTISAYPIIPVITGMNVFTVGSPINISVNSVPGENYQWSLLSETFTASGNNFNPTLTIAGLYIARVYAYNTICSTSSENYFITIVGIPTSPGINTITGSTTTTGVGTVAGTTITGLTTITSTILITNGVTITGITYYVKNTDGSITILPGASTTLTGTTNLSDFNEIEELGFEVYPNPTSGTFKIIFSNHSSGTSGNCYVYNSLGQHIATLQQGEAILPTGFYLLRFGKKLKKLIVE